MNKSKNNKCKNNSIYVHIHSYILGTAGNTHPTIHQHNSKSRRKNQNILITKNH